jgi:1-phosphofructokinase
VKRSPNVLVVALNPSIDVEWRVDAVRWEEKNTILSERRWPGGKGVNVARWLQHLGCAPRLLLPAGGRNGEELLQGLKQAALQATSLKLPGETRANIIVTSAEGGQLRFNPAGPSLTREWREFVSAFRRQLSKCSLVVFSGSQPRSLHNDAYAQLITIAQRSGVRSILDCDGAPFKHGVRAKPFLVKPNVYELGSWCGCPLRTRSQIIGAARRLARQTGNWVLVSRGSKGGILLNASGKTFEAGAPSNSIVNTVGAGDAMLAGFASSFLHDQSPADWLQDAIACGTAAVGCHAGILPGRRRVAEIARKVQVTNTSSAA